MLALAKIAPEEGAESVVAGQARIFDANGEDVTETFLQGARIAYSMCRMLTGELVESIADWLEANGNPLGVNSPRAQHA